MTATLRIPWVIDAAGTWMRAETAPVGQPLFCPLCNQPVILKRGALQLWYHRYQAPNAPD
jgi:competence CoiA-like predicted nuclease